MRLASNTERKRCSRAAGPQRRRVGHCVGRARRAVRPRAVHVRHCAAIALAAKLAQARCCGAHAFHAHDTAVAEEAHMTNMCFAQAGAPRVKGDQA